MLGQDVEKIGIERPLDHENSDPTTIYSRILPVLRSYLLVFTRETNLLHGCVTYLRILSYSIIVQLSCRRKRDGNVSFGRPKVGFPLSNFFARCDLFPLSRHPFFHVLLT